MNSAAIQELLQKRPFEPFEVRLSNGEVHQVRHPECVWLAGTRLFVYYPENDRVTICSLIHLNSVHILQAA